MWRRLGAKWGIVRGWFLLILHSRVAPYIPEALTAAAVLFAALPDGGIRVRPQIYFPGIIALYLLGTAGTRLVRGTQLAAYARTSTQLGSIISSLASHTGGGKPRILKKPEKAVELLLRRAKELVVTSLNVPVGTVVCANLLLPVTDESGDIVGLLAIDHDDYQPDRPHTPIPLDAPGAGEAFLSGRACAIPNVLDESHPRLQNVSYRSVGAFPICVGEPAQDGVIVAILSIDSDRAYTFDEKDVKQLEPFMSPIAQLIGLAMQLKQQGGR